MGVKQIVFTGKKAPPLSSGGGLQTFDYVMIAILLVLIAISIYYIVTTPGSVKIQEKFSEKKGRIVYVYMQGCPYCVKFDKTFDEIKADKIMTSSYKTEKIDVKSDDAKKWTEKYKCNGFPCYIVVDSNDELVKQGTGYRSLDDFKSWLAS